MLLQQLSRFGSRGPSPLALLSASFSTGAKPHFPAAATAGSAAVCFAVESARSTLCAAGSSGTRWFRAPQAAAAAAAAYGLRSAGAAACQQPTACTATTAAAKERRVLGVPSRHLLAVAAASILGSSHSATAPPTRGPQLVDARRGMTAGTSFGGASARSYAATAPPPRDPRFATLEEADLDAFRGMLGAGNVLTDASALQAVNKDWMQMYEGHSQVALRPKTTEQVSQVLAHCNARRLAVVPQGGNTGLVGGSVPMFDEVVLCTAGLSDIRSFDPVTGILVCDAGCILEALDNYLNEQGFGVPLDLGAKGSCQIGGNVSTNAGGLRFLRYGSLRGTVLGVEAVLPDGTVLDLLHTLRKDNTGYDLKQLFIGGEGTLGVVTAVALLTAPKWASVNVAYLAVPSWDAAQKVFVSARRHLGEILSAFEFLDRQALAVTLEQLPNVVQDPLPDTEAPIYLLVETSGSNAEHDTAKLDAFLEDALGSGIVADGTVAQDSAQAGAIWGLRESISEGLRHRGPVYKYDLSVPIGEMYNLVEETRKRVAGHQDVQVVAYGHMGDGNVHLNVSAPGGHTPELTAAVEPFVYDWTAAHRGSVSAEHGLGQMKLNWLRYSKPAEAIDIMHRVKAMLDPNQIMNPYKFLPPADPEHLPRP